MYSNRARKSKFRNGRRQGKKKEENGFQYPVKGIAKIRILARFMSMVIICEESSVYKGCESGKGNHQRGRERVGKDDERDGLPLRSCQRTFHTKIRQINRVLQTFT